MNLFLSLKLAWELPLSGSPLLAGWHSSGSLMMMMGPDGCVELGGWEVRANCNRGSIKAGSVHSHEQGYGVTRTVGG